MKVFSLSAGLIPVIILFVIGLLIKYKKAYYLISGYNTMSEEKKKNVDIEKLGRFTANVCFTIAAIIFSASVLMFFEKIAAAGVVFVLIIPTVIYTLVNAQKYDGNTRNSNGKMKTGTKVLIAVIISIIALTSIGVGVLLYFSNKPAEYALENGIFDISGMYGQKIPVNEIQSLEIKESMPEVISRTNGSDLNNMLKGYFKVKDIGKVKLFVDKSKPPFIYLKDSDKTIIFNCGQSQKTKELYEKLRKEWENSKDIK